MGGLFDNPLHLLLLIVVIVLLFGATKLGDVGGALGKSIREFKKEATTDDGIRQARLHTPPPTAYIPPAQAAHGYEPPASAPAAGHVPTEPVRRPEYLPGDYRPGVIPPTPPPPASSVPPDYSGR